jgi:Fe-S-cluster-containing dehydrogenase component
MKCDMCYDRTSVGRMPMCASVCPSGALAFGKRHDILERRPGSRPVNEFRFGNQTITTKVQMMAPKSAVQATYVDVTEAMNEAGLGKRISFDLLSTLHDPEEAPV